MEESLYVKTSKQGKLTEYFVLLYVSKVVKCEVSFLGFIKHFKVKVAASTFQFHLILGKSYDITQKQAFLRYDVVGYVFLFHICTPNTYLLRNIRA